LPAKYCRGVRVLWKILIKVSQFELSQPFAGVGNGELFLQLVLGLGIEARLSPPSQEIIAVFGAG